MLSGRGELFGVYFHGNRNSNKIALTFDADMTYGMQQLLLTGKVKSFYDKPLIELLKKLDTPATLFLTGMWVEQYPEVVKELSSNPLFEMGSHSYAHKAYSSPCYSLDPILEEDKIQDIGASQFLIEHYSKKKTVLFRFPGGCFGPGDLALLKLAGAKAIAWDVVADDGFSADTKGIVQRVVSRTKNGSIIVMHMNGFPNEPVDFIAVPEIVKELRARGFEFVTITKLLNF